MLNTSTYPYEYIRINLPLNLHYRVTAFIDANGNGTQDASEITDNGRAIFHSFVADLTAMINSNTKFMDSFGDQVQLDRGESISLDVMAFDFPDQNWTIETAILPRKIELSGSALDVIDINGSRGVVRSDAPFGDYELTFIATDDSGSLSAPLTRKVKVIDMTPPTITLLSQDESGNNSLQVGTW